MRATRGERDDARMFSVLDASLNWIRTPALDTAIGLGQTLAKANLARIWPISGDRPGAGLAHSKAFILIVSVLKALLKWIRTPALEPAL